VDTDEHPRYKKVNGEYSIDLTLEKLSLLKPIFRKNGTVTAGNSSGINDGAAAVLLMSREKADELGLKPIVRWVGSAVAGVDPSVMGYGPVPSTEKLLKRFNLTLDDIGLIELNEAFASQSIGVMRKLNMNPEITNVNGGAIALGHPLGCSGTRILTTLIHEMKKRDTKYGLATLCVGVGQGVSTIVERL
jgi:acetyl-CoA acetyltransferase family protein